MIELLEDLAHLRERPALDGYDRVLADVQPARDLPLRESDIAHHAEPQAEDLGLLLREGLALEAPPVWNDPLAPTAPFLFAGARADRSFHRAHYRSSPSSSLFQRFGSRRTHRAQRASRASRR